MAALYLLAD